ncbi:MAG: hypothetical protein AAF685_11940 [Cyanobacteria bacterium P01_C01_bin.89]
MHFQDDSTIEIIAKPIPRLRYGDEVKLLVDSQEVEILDGVETA